MGDCGVYDSCLVFTGSLRRYEGQTIQLDGAWSWSVNVFPPCDPSYADGRTLFEVKQDGTNWITIDATTLLRSTSSNPKAYPPCADAPVSCVDCGGSGDPIACRFIAGSGNRILAVRNTTSNDLPDSASSTESSFIVAPQVTFW